MAANTTRTARRMHFHYVRTCQRSDLPETYGVYWLVALARPRQLVNGWPRPRAIPRLTGTDPAGILYIGSTERQSFRWRTAKLILALNECNRMTPWSRLGRSGYTCVYSYFHAKRTAEAYPVDDMIIVLEETPASDAVHLEGKYLYNYRQEFGELPPLNRSFPSGIDDLANPDQAGPLAFTDEHYAPWYRPAP